MSKYRIFGLRGSLQLLLILTSAASVLSAIDYNALQAGTIINQYESVVALLTEDWCDACKALEKPFNNVEAQVQAKFPSAKFIIVNLDSNNEAWKFYGARTLPHVSFVQRGIPLGYVGELDETKLQKWIVKKITSTPVELVPDKHLKYKLKKSSSRFIFVGPKDSYEFDEIEVLAKVTSSKIYYTSDAKVLGSTDSQYKDIPPISFVRLNVKSGKVVRYQGAQFDAHRLKRFMVTSGLAYPETFDQKLVSEYMNEGIPILLLYDRDFTNNESLEWIKGLKGEISSSMAVVRFSNFLDPPQGVFLRYCEVPHYTPASACIVEPNPVMRRYVIKGEFSQVKMLDLVQQWLAGKASPHFKMEQILSEWEGSVKNLNTKTLDLLMTTQRDKDKVVFIYSSRTPEDSVLLGLFMMMAEQLQHLDCIFARLNMDANEIPEMENVALPSLAILKGFGDLTAATFEGEWDTNQLKRFITSKCKPVPTVVGSVNNHLTSEDSHHKASAHHSHTSTASPQPEPAPDDIDL